MNADQIKSKQRVTDHGEVLTGEREVNAMLDLVKDQTEQIDRSFLEPACGTGNFLAEILRRKLAKVEKTYRRSQSDYEKYAVLAVSSIYGIDILFDNVHECRERLFNIFKTAYTGLFKKKAKDRCLKAVHYILGCNIVHGDALSLKTVGDDPQPIVFSEWKPSIGNKFKRRDFAFHDLTRPEESGRKDLFAEQRGIVERDDGGQGFIPEPVRTDYKPVPYWELPNAE